MAEDVKAITDLTVKEISIVVWGANNKGFYSVKENKTEDNEEIFWLSKGDKTMVEANDKSKVIDEKNKKDNITKEIEAISKEDLVKEVLSLRQSTKDLNEALTKSISDAKTEKDLRIEKEFIQKAKDEFNVLGDSVVIGKVLKEASEKLSKENYDALSVIMKASQEKISKGALFIEAGTDNAQSATDNISKIDVMAKELMQKEKISYDDALSKIFKDNETLLKEYINEEI